MTINEKFLEVTHFHPPYFLQLVIELLENTSDEQALSDNSVFTGIFINSEGKSIGKMDYNKVSGIMKIERLKPDVSSTT